MEEHVGIACGECDTFSPMGTERCPSCGRDLSLFSRGAAESPEPVTAQQEEPMEQARYYVCKECSTPVPPGHKFCGACGTTVPKDVLERPVEFFGAMQAPGKARLIVIRGMQGSEGLSYSLEGTDHFAGSTADSAISFPGDTWLSPRHANFVYEGEVLTVRDEGSTNGVYVRVREPVNIAPGEQFVCGEQVFRLDQTPPDTSGPGPDQTHFYSSPKRPSPFRLTQILAGGAEGMVYCARDNSVQIGREDSDMNFPDDLFMSGSHAKLELAADGTFQLVDLNSRNGTYMRISGSRALGHGDYLFVGHQLLRVEQTV
jgi:pSer/pThr/pTyr-binding forkhead associated (FHA) protein/RNA polymerase subunit RPABC4/transcription elongation factor Spt4